MASLSARFVSSRTFGWQRLEAPPGMLIVLEIGQVLQRLVYQISPHDPLTLISILGLILLVAIASSLIPARRATRIDPMAALRRE